MNEITVEVSTHMVPHFIAYLYSSFMSRTSTITRIRKSVDNKSHITYIPHENSDYYSQIEILNDWGSEIWVLDNGIYRRPEAIIKKLIEQRKKELFATIDRTNIDLFDLGFFYGSKGTLMHTVELEEVCNKYHVSAAIILNVISALIERYKEKEHAE